MISLHPDCPPGATLLADHLDATLAAGEDLLVSSLAARADLDESEPEAAPEALNRFVARLRRLEAALLLRVLQARRHIDDIARGDPLLKASVSLFRAETVLLQELIDGSRSNPEEALEGGDSFAYLRSRGLLAPEAAGLSYYEGLAVSEAFRIGGVARLGQVLDMVSAFLDLLDARFGLYAPDVEDDVADPTGIEFGNGTVLSGEIATGSGEISLNEVVAGLRRAEETAGGVTPPVATTRSAGLDDIDGIAALRMPSSGPDETTTGAGEHQPDPDGPHTMSSTAKIVSRAE
jgi:hypothetical protein